jgi:excisionase family DNA binding protein
MVEANDLLPADRPLYTIPEAAKALRISRSTVYELLSAGRLRKVKVGYLSLIRRDDLADFINSASSGGEAQHLTGGKH